MIIIGRETRPDYYINTPEALRVLAGTRTLLSITVILVILQTHAITKNIQSTNMPFRLSQCSLLPFGTRVLEFLAKTWPYFKPAFLVQNDFSAFLDTFPGRLRAWPSQLRRGKSLGCSTKSFCRSSEVNLVLSNLSLLVIPWLGSSFLILL